MEDVVENTKETSQVCHDIKEYINESLDELVKESEKSLTYLTKETDKMTSDNRAHSETIRNILNQANAKSVKDAKGNFDNIQRVLNSYFAEMGNIVQKSKKIMESEFKRILDHSDEHTKSIINIDDIDLQIT